MYYISSTIDITWNESGGCGLQLGGVTYGVFISATQGINETLYLPV